MGIVGYSIGIFFPLPGKILEPLFLELEAFILTAAVLEAWTIVFLIVMQWLLGACGMTLRGLSDPSTVMACPPREFGGRFIAYSPSYLEAGSGACC
jgi:hypothetical protein